jgi:sugar phosphate isomerase/epimerase
VRYGISTHLYHDRPLGPEHLAEIAGFGFREIELFAVRGHFDYDRPPAVEALAGWLDATGLTLHSVHAPLVDRVDAGSWGRLLSTAAGDDAARAEAVAECVAALGVARTIRFRFLVVHLGVPQPSASDGHDNLLPAALRSLDEIASAAARAGVRVAVEVIPNQLSTPERLVEIVDSGLASPAPGPGICLDTGHAALMGDLADAIDTVAGALVTTHVHDNGGRVDDHLAPFDGRIDWPTAVMTLRKVGYEGALMFELARTAAPAVSLAKAAAARDRFEGFLAPGPAPGC